MPNTVKRNYPYPALQGEPPNIPLALENLANAIETDLENVTAQIPENTVKELESRAALMEGRLTNLEQRKPQVDKRTVDSGKFYGSTIVNAPAGTIASTVISIDRFQYESTMIMDGREYTRLNDLPTSDLKIEFNSDASTPYYRLIYKGNQQANMYASFTVAEVKYS